MQCISDLTKPRATRICSGLFLIFARRESAASAPALERARRALILYFIMYRRHQLLCSRDDRKNFEDRNAFIRRGVVAEWRTWQMVISIVESGMWIYVKIEEKSSYNKRREMWARNKSFTVWDLWFLLFRHSTYMTWNITLHFISAL